MKIFFLIVFFIFTISAAIAEQYIDKLTVKKELRLQGEETSSALIIDNNSKVKASSLVGQDELEYLDGVTSAIQGQIDGKQATISGAASTITSSDLSASKALQSDGSGKVSVSSTVDTTELGYLDGVTSGIQSQFTSVSSTESTNDGLSVHKAGSETITGDKLFTGQLTATSTTKGNRPCPVMTPTQRNAIASPALGDCVINSVSNGLETFDGSIWKAAGGSGGGISNWVTATAYIIGDVVIQSNKIYQANTAHTSGTFSSDLSNWTQIANNVTDASGVLPIANGGTNSSTALSGSSIIVSDGTKLIQGAAGTSTTLLHGNASGAPTYAAASLTADVSGILPLANGGANKNLTPVSGGVLYTDADSHEVSAAGTSGQILQSNGASSPGFVNKSISGKAENKTAVTLEEIQFPNNQLTETDSGKYLANTGNKNLLDNAGFEHGTFSTSWTSSAGTFTKETSTVIDGKASAKLVLSAQTVSLTQSSTLYASAFTDGSQGLVSARIKSDVALKLCAIQAGVVSTTDCLDIVGDNQWGHFQVPTLLGATSNGISIASSGNVTGTVYIDDTFVGLADPFVSAPLITDWVDFPSVAAGTLITATTTNPAYGTVVTNKAQWRRVGSNMEIRWDYRQSAASATVGSGNYLFNLPAGYQMDTSKTSTNSSIGSTVGAGFDSMSLGSLNMTYSTNTSAFGVISAYSSTQLKAHINNGPGGASVWGTSTFDFGVSATMSFGLRASIPILGWSSSINTITQQCQNDTECANEFSAKISSTGVVSGENVDWISGNCTNVSAMVCTINTGVFSNTPNCEVTINDTTSGREAHINSQTSTSFTVSRQESGSTITKTDFGVSVLCQKSGTDYKSRRAIVGSFKNVVTTQGVNKPTTSSAIVAGGTESTICTVTGNCTLYRPRGNFITSVAKTATGGSYTVTLDSTKINVSTVSCFTNVIRDTSGNQVCHPSTMGATFTVFCRDVTSNAVANNMFRLSCEGDSL